MHNQRVCDKEDADFTCAKVLSHRIPLYVAKKERFLDHFNQNEASTLTISAVVFERQPPLHQG